MGGYPIAGGGEWWQVWSLQSNEFRVKSQMFFAILPQRLWRFCPAIRLAYDLQ
jgi:hypothetical protein